MICNNEELIRELDKDIYGFWVGSYNKWAGTQCVHLNVYCHINVMVIIARGVKKPYLEMPTGRRITLYVGYGEIGLITKVSYLRTKAILEAAGFGGLWHTF